MNNRRIKLILAFVIGLMPSNIIRCFLYRTLCGYQISQAYVGWGTVLAAAEVQLTECRIGRKNKFVGPMRVVINKGCTIGDMNTFDCGWWVAEENFESFNYDRNLDIGRNTIITSNHHFDVVGELVLGDDSWVAGTGSQFWTHGAGVKKRNISVGKGCYLGSAVRFSPGSSIGDNCIVGLGSIVTRKFNEKNAIIAGHPANIIRENYDWKTKKDRWQENGQVEA